MVLVVDQYVREALADLFMARGVERDPAAVFVVERVLRLAL